MWSIVMEIAGTPVERTIYVAEGSIDLFAKTLSMGTKERVKICCMARIRRVYQNGKMITDMPSLRHFYSNISNTQEWQWKEMNPVDE